MWRALFNHYLLQSFETDDIIIIFTDEEVEAKRSYLLQGMKQLGDGQHLHPDYLAQGLPRWHSDTEPSC